MKLVISIFTLVFASAVFAGPDHMKPPTVPKDFEALKALEGTWEGKSDMHGKEEKVSINYKVTSAGTTLVETMGAGSPHEMVTVYSARKDKVAMKHYCAAGNQPELKLKKATKDTFVFEMDGNKGIDDPKEMHMHSLTITMKDPTHLKQEWISYADGKKGETAVFEFTKK